MKRCMSLALRLLIGTAGCSLAATSCALDIRDAFVSGALEYVSGTTTQLLSQLIILPGDEASEE